MNKPTVSHAAPKVFLRGEYAFRNVNGAIAIIGPLVMGAILAFSAVYIPGAGDTSLSRIVNIVLAVGALVLSGFGLWALWGWVRNARIRVEINENGIIRGDRFWPWEQVRSFAGWQYVNGVSLEFKPRGMMIVWNRGDLPITPLLSEQQYIELARELQQCISKRFPHVDVALHPLKPSI
jgi:hypothetical protein